MQPYPSDILRGVLENLEALVFPQLEDDHAKSVAKCTRILINHVILRLEQEIPALLQDSEEKRQLLNKLADDIAALPTPQADSLQSLAQSLRTGADEPPLSDSAATLEVVTAENDWLKETLEKAIYALHDKREELGEAHFARLNGAIRRQLRAQTERELALVAPAYGEDPFPF